MARGRANRQYTRDNGGRFSSTPGGGGGRSAGKVAARKKAKAAAVTGGTLAARSRLGKSRAKLAANATAAQRGAVTRGSRALQAVKAAATRKISGGGAAAGVMRGKVKRDPGAKGKMASGGGAGGGGGGRRPNAAAQRAKRLADQKGTVAGRNFQDGKAVGTMSLRELRSAVRADARKVGIETRKEFLYLNGLSKAPRTRSDWEKLYRQNVGVPQADRGRRERPGVINGVDIHKNFRPWAVYGLNPKTASRADVEGRFRQLAKQNHPDVGGRRKDFERLKAMRDSMLAFKPQPGATKGGSKPAGGGSRGKGRKAAGAAAQTASRSPLLLPPARSAAPAAAATGRRRKRSS
jgi:hypothetical protein